MNHVYFDTTEVAKRMRESCEAAVAECLRRASSDRDRDMIRLAQRLIEPALQFQTFLVECHNEEREARMVAMILAQEIANIVLPFANNWPGAPFDKIMMVMKQLEPLLVAGALGETPDGVVASRGTVPTMSGGSA